MNFRRSEEKDAWLMQNRGFSFEDIVSAIGDDNLLVEELHDNQKKYPGQYIYFVHMGDYVYRVPFVREENGDIFLKTAMASRIAKKRFIG